MRRLKPPHPCAFPAVLNAAWAATGYGLGYAMQDPDAAAYVAAVEAAGVTVTNDQRTAIDTFVTTGKGDGWYSSLKRLYLPIWASAAPNAIDMISRTSGTFVGAVDHEAGYVQGNGATGYFNIGTTQSAQGLSISSGYHFALCTTTSTLGFRGLLGRAQGSLSVAASFSSSAAQLFRWNTTAGQLLASSAGTGILSFSRQGGNRSIYRRATAARSVLVSTAGADAGTMPTGGNSFALALNVNNGTGETAGEFNDAKFGSFGFGIGLTDSDDASFTLALKNLWETCTGLTLP